MRADLNGAGVFEDGQNEDGGTATGAVCAELDAHVLEALVKEGRSGCGGERAIRTECR
jgi:hypothetical protein